MAKNWLKATVLGASLAGFVTAGAAPAAARDHRRYDQRWDHRYDQRYDHRYDRRDNDAGVAIVAGVIGLALGAAIASNQDDRRYDARYDRGYDPRYGQPYYGRSRVCVRDEQVWDYRLNRYVLIRRQYAC